MKTGLVVGVAGTLLAGCATVGPDLSKDLQPAKGIGDSVECSGDCETEWQRAQVWLTRHSRWKLQTATDTTITTYNPSRHDPSYGFTVVKEPLPQGNSRITLDITPCGNIYGCSPEKEEIRKGFLYYVKTGKDLLKGVKTGHAIK